MIRNVELNNYMYSFDSLSDFYKYICETSLNDVFRFRKLISSECNSDALRFTKTRSFEQASELLKNGWKEMAATIEQKLDAEKNQIELAVKNKMFYDVQGFQCSVPRYLQGIPTNMISVKKMPCKKKVITICKSVNYSASVDADTIIKESVKTLQIVRKLEAQGYAVNVDIAIGAKGNVKLFAKIRIKNSSERLNVSKMAFPLVHPSMLRRLMFRFIEVCPDTTKDFAYGYGSPIKFDEMKRVIKNEYIIPSQILTDMNKLKDINSIESIEGV